MTDLHERLARFLDRTGALATTMFLRRGAPIPTVSIVTFHRLAEPDDGDPFDPDVVDATPAQFRRHVETLARVGTPIGMDRLIASLHGASLPPNPLMVTFDDGYRSCCDVALPILLELGVPATFFIATRLTSSRTLFWWEKIAVFLRTARRTQAELSYPYPLRIDARDPRARRMLDDLVKNTNGLALDRFLAELCAALDVEWDAHVEARAAASLLATWDEIRVLAAAGMDVESHTRTHRVLDTLSDAELHDELAGSRRDLEAQIGRPVRAIAYPVGRRPADRVRRATADAGYQIAFTNSSGVNTLWPRWMRDTDPFDMHRLAAERTQSDALFLAQVALPMLAYTD